MPVPANDVCSLPDIRLVAARQQDLALYIAEEQRTLVIDRLENTKLRLREAMQIRVLLDP